MRPIAQAGFRAVAVDQRGYSPEARPQEVKDYAIEQLISDVQGFVNALGCRHFHLVGHDWGALLAWEFAAKHPDRLQSLSEIGRASCRESLYVSMIVTSVNSTFS